MQVDGWMRVSSRRPEREDMDARKVVEVSKHSNDDFYDADFGFLSIIPFPSGKTMIFKGLCLIYPVLFNSP